MKQKVWSVFIVVLVLAGALHAQTNSTFIIGTYNVENWNYIERNKKPNQPKSQSSKEAVVHVITSVRPDVLGIQEMGNETDFAELRSMLSSNGLDYAHWEWVPGADPDRHVCLLSRFPILSRQSRTGETYLLNARPTPMGRGIVDVTIRVNDQYAFRAMVVHLKSKRQTETGDQAEMRLGESRLLRNQIDKIFAKDPHANFIAMGDFNDTPDSDSIRLAVGQPPHALFFLPCKTQKGYTGTHFWRGKREWSRIDYLMASPGMSNEYVTGTATIHEGEEAFTASDHRMIYAQFHDYDIGPAPTAAPPANHAAPHLPVGWIVTGVLLLVVLVAIAIAIATRRKKQP